MPSAKEKTLAQIMRKKGATGIPNENTYVATAQEQAVKGDLKGAEETMQYSIKNPAQKQIAEQDSQRGADMAEQITRNVVKALKKKKGKK